MSTHFRPFDQPTTFTAHGHLFLKTHRHPFQCTTAASTMPAGVQEYDLDDFYAFGMDKIKGE